MISDRLRPKQFRSRALPFPDANTSFYQTRENPKHLVQLATYISQAAIGKRLRLRLRSFETIARNGRSLVVQVRNPLVLFIHSLHALTKFTQSDIFCHGVGRWQA